ncbi:MAG: phosphoenolpyruvate carboxykinase domain-containing protein [Ilumatobacteraceae bacterium]
MAMLPFCGYNYADYFAHWLTIGKATDPNNLPKIFFVNWFTATTRDASCGPDSVRTAACSSGSSGGATAARRSSTPVGRLPTQEALDLDGLEVDAADLEALLSVDAAGWRGRHPESASTTPS